MADIAVFGMGYLGATHAACMADLGQTVLDVDVDEAEVVKLASGNVPFSEPELADGLTANLTSGRLRFTTSYEDAAAHPDVHFLAVGTQQKEGEFAADPRFADASTDHNAEICRRSDINMVRPTGTREKVGAISASLSRFDVSRRSEVAVPMDADIGLRPDYLRCTLSFWQTVRWHEHHVGIPWLAAVAYIAEHILSSFVFWIAIPVLMILIAGITSLTTGSVLLGIPHVSHWGTRYVVVSGVRSGFDVDRGRRAHRPGSL